METYVRLERLFFYRMGIRKYIHMKTAKAYEKRGYISIGAEKTITILPKGDEVLLQHNGMIIDKYPILGEIDSIAGINLVYIDDEDDRLPTFAVSCWKAQQKALGEIFKEKKIPYVLNKEKSRKGRDLWFFEDIEEHRTDAELELLRHGLFMEEKPLSTERVPAFVDELVVVLKEDLRKKDLLIERLIAQVEEIAYRRNVSIRVAYDAVGDEMIPRVCWTGR